MAHRFGSLHLATVILAAKAATLLVPPGSGMINDSMETRFLLQFSAMLKTRGVRHRETGVYVEFQWEVCCLFNPAGRRQFPGCFDDNCGNVKKGISYRYLY